MTDLVVHDSTQAHDADVYIVFLADQPGVFQSSPARQCVAANTDYRKDKNNSVIMRSKGCFSKSVESISI